MQLFDNQYINFFPKKCRSGVDFFEGMEYINLQKGKMQFEVELCVDGLEKRESEVRLLEALTVSPLVSIRRLVGCPCPMTFAPLPFSSGSDTLATKSGVL